MFRDQGSRYTRMTVEIVKKVKHGPVETGLVALGTRNVGRRAHELVHGARAAKTR